MKNFKSFIAFVLSLALILGTAVFTSAEEENTEEMLLEIRVMQDHPGIKGYDVTYTFTVLYGTEYDKVRLNSEDFVLSCAEKKIKIKDNIVTVPASFKDNTDVDGVKIYATYKGLSTYYPLMIKNWNMTFEDNFDGDSLDPKKWASSEGKFTEIKDLGYGKTAATSDEATTVKNGNLVMSVKSGEGVKIFSNGERVDDVDFIMSSVSTQDVFTQRFGLFMSSMKFPTDTIAGSCSAFWLLPGGGDYGKTFFASQRYGVNTGFSVGEIDTIEYSPAWRDYYEITTHWWNNLNYTYGGNTFNKKVTDQNLNKGDYVNVATVWTENSLYNYYNGELKQRVINLEPDEKANAYMLFTLIAGGYDDTPKWAGSFTEADLDKMVTYVDWCRAYN